MPSVDQLVITRRIVRESQVVRSPRVMQVSGLFDVPNMTEVREAWDLDFTLPATWNIGVLVGPSGSGKSTICHDVFGDYLPRPFAWPDDRSVLDAFPEGMGIKAIVEMLSSVGFSSPPSWLKPYAVLSNGEQFRVTLARHLAEMGALCVLDEYSSVIDRQVAQVCSLAFAKAVRRMGKRVILATCHYDVLPWLEPDWVYEPHLGHLDTGRSLRRPPLELSISSVGREAWHIFKKHHYLSADLSTAAHCFCAYLQGVPVAFNAWLHQPHAQRIPMKRSSRMVVLPDYQGIGIGQRFLDTMASVVRGAGFRAVTTTAHPARRWALGRSPLWTRTSAAGLREKRHSRLPNAFGRFTESFEYYGPAAPRGEAQALWNGV
jgi:GNAT superfamily N-acetyltransferase